jgi:hypothetical protein
MPDQPPCSDWEQHKDVIQKLYQAKPLKEVMTVMRTEYGFEKS